MILRSRCKDRDSHYATKLGLTLVTMTLVTKAGLG